MITDQGRDGGFCLESLHLTQLNIVVGKAPVLSGQPRAALVGGAGNRWSGGFVMQNRNGDWKRCAKCKEWKPKSEFHKKQQQADGFNPRCKLCNCQDVKLYNEKNKVAISERQKMSYALSPQAARQRSTRYYAANRDKCRALFAIYRHANRDRLSQKAQERRSMPSVKERMARNASLHYLQNRDRYIQRAREWLRAHPDTRRDMRARRRARQRTGIVEHFPRVEIYTRDGGRCHVCGRRVSIDNWHLDHLKPLALGGAHARQNVAVACPTCNVRRGHRGPAQLRLFG